MPGMDGLKAARTLRDRLPATPIILFTVYANAVSTRDAMAAWIRSIVSKSDMDELISEAEAHLKLRESAAG